MKTYVACLTPPGKAAIATISVWGPNAWTIARGLFKPRRTNLPVEAPANKCWFGRLGAESHDDVILAVKEGRSFPVVEIHCHGGVAIVRMIQGLFEQQGAQLVSWPDFLGSDSRGRILSLLTQASTTRTAGILLDQWRGPDLTQGEYDIATLRRLHDLIPLGKHLIAPWKIVIAGAPNVGKSSLMNALAGYTRSVVSPVPGTTRDVVATRLAIDGWPIEMIDTAGLRRSAVELERRGIERAREALKSADLRLWVLDGSEEPIFPDDREGWCLVINKSDLPAAWEGRDTLTALRLSAQTGAGLPELCDRIAHLLVLAPPAPGEAVPCLPEQIEWVRHSITAWERAHGMAR